MNDPSVRNIGQSKMFAGFPKSRSFYVSNKIQEMRLVSSIAFEREVTGGVVHQVPVCPIEDHTEAVTCPISLFPFNVSPS